MLVKVFEAPDMSSALKLVKAALGPDALILSTRTVRKGPLGVFGGPLLEVTAAVETKPGTAVKGRAPNPQIQAPPAAPAVVKPTPPAATEARALPEEELQYQDLWKSRKVIDPLEDEVRELKKQLAGQNLDSVRGEMNELKALVKELAQRNQEPAAFVSQPLAAEPEFGLLNAELLRCGLEGPAAERIVRAARESLSPAQLQNPAVLLAFVRQAVASLVAVTGSLFAGRQGQQRLALVGPTGVGKTTTLAKLAADYLMHYGSRVAMVTIDTYRIAAVEQLKVYGGIMDVPVEVVFSPQQLREAFARHSDKDLILIDTSGRSPRDAESIRELGTFLDPALGVETHLVLAAITRDGEMRETVRRFGRLAPQSLIFTKIDECDQCGALVNLPVSQNLPLSYLTNGQRVPEDLAVATAPMVTGYVLGQERVAGS